MRVFAIQDDDHPKTSVIGYLLYYDKAKSFYIELPPNADPWEVPLLLSSLLKRGKHTVNAYWSKLWVQQRIIPQDRQNLGQILKENKLDSYDEFSLLMLGHGRCAQDSYYLKEIGIDAIPPEITDRWQYKVEDAVPLDGNQLLVFFRDGAVKKCDAEAMTAEFPGFASIMNNNALFQGVRIQTDGYGVMWGDHLTISDDDLYAKGVHVPVSMNDFLSFIKHRVLNSLEAQELLGCTRQNINDLVKRGSLHPIREDAKNKLFLRSEIEQRLNK